jgi:hypothetical protein
VTPEILFPELNAIQLKKLKIMLIQARIDEHQSLEKYFNNYGKRHSLGCVLSLESHIKRIELSS